MTVLDASAVIAWLRQEPGADQVDVALQNAAVISAVNFAEVLSKVGERGGDVRAAARDLRIEGLRVEPYGDEDAVVTAELRVLTQAQGLSLGDRACLALARRLGLPALTADQQWANINVGVKVQLIR
ncbi:PIN domain-containing protein [Deinococcus aquatilis]|uniref:PIN domain-containing protein n=1 Tax=Deinococcus aquatilis TaxID=519440 RepID=UPI000360B318|nr:type II toxin-antitoxin system VapC family toxin [Deinococcus aquatilis]